MFKQVLKDFDADSLYFCACWMSGGNTLGHFHFLLPEITECTNEVSSH